MKSFLKKMLPSRKAAEKPFTASVPPTHPDDVPPDIGDAGRPDVRKPPKKHRS